MIRHHCPNCELLIDSSAELVGLEVLCPHCRVARVEVPAHSETDRRAQRNAELEAAAAGVPVLPPRVLTPTAAPGHCFLCDRGAEVQPWYVRVNKRNVGASNYRDRWVTLRGPCCQGCVSALGALRRFRIWFALFIFLIFPVVFCGGIPVLLLEVFGAPRPVVVGVFLALTVAALVLMIGGPLWLHFHLKRRILKMLHADTAEMLRSLPVGWNAGLTSELIVSAAPPPGGQVVEVGPGSRRFG